MKRAVLYYSLSVLLVPLHLRGQDTLRNDSLRNFLTGGTFQLESRYFLMTTHNRDSLSDYYANAAGVGVGYTSATFKGFGFGLSGFYFWNIGSSDLSRPDPATGAVNRYEIGLFDLEEPNRKDFKRLEELYIRYTFGKSSIRYGKMILSTPLINKQDGRMRPTAEEGIWLDVQELKRFKMEGGWLYRMAPRSTTRWYSVPGSIGLYPEGVSPDGKPSGYRNALRSAGIGTLGVTATYPNTTVQVWDVWVENIFNTAMLQVEQKVPFRRLRGKATVGGMLLQQNGMGKGDEDPEKIYYQRSGQSMVASFRIGFTGKRWHTDLNYTRITRQGRYLMPREWGRDPFYTFLSREKNEGFGNVHAWSWNGSYAFPGTSFKLAAGIGQYRLPDVRNTRLNKYGMPSYRQYNLEARYSGKGALKGMEVQLLYVYKENTGNVYGNPRYVFDKVDMGNFNLVLNYQFGGKIKKNP